MPNIENLRKQPKLILRWHRGRHFLVAAQISSGLARYSRMTKFSRKAFKLGDAQELAARQHGLQSWQALKGRNQHHLGSSRDEFPPQLFVADIGTPCEFFAGRLGSSPRSPMASRRFTRRSGATVRAPICDVWQPVIDAEVQDREQLLSASLTVATPGQIKALFLQYPAAGVTLFQTLKREPWGARVSSGIRTELAGPAE